MERAKGGTLDKRKGGRGGRFAIKKNKISHTEKDATGVSTKRPRMENNTLNLSNSNIEGIQLPETLAIEKETLSRAINDEVIWDPFVEDEELMDLIMPSPYSETGRGTLDLSGKKANLVVCPNEERTRANSILYPSGGEEENDRFGLFYEGIDNEMLSINEVMDKELVDPDGESTLNEGQNGVRVHSEERPRVVLSPNKTVNVFESIGSLSWNGESGGLYSCSSISTSGFDDFGVDWSWDDVMGEHVEIGDESIEENMLSWLWETDKGEG